ncbi:MAG: hypothetical protein OEZ33_10875 [Gammaproteobacteria bacterium]|nr:hypothetical protein [Gammaproteobacteria bacterium]
MKKQTEQFSRKIVLAIFVCLFTTEGFAVEQKKNAIDLRKQLIQNPVSIPKLLQQGKIALQDIPNPHWQKDGCAACHTGRQPNKTNLRTSKGDQLCNSCHEKLSAHDYIHISDIKLPSKMNKNLPASFKKAIRKNGNRVGCTTCHDLPMTCKKNRQKEQGKNPLFFRSGPYDSRTGLCYHCHDASKYKRVNAHDQITNKGKVKKETCLICHRSHDDLFNREKANSQLKYNLKDNLSRLCWGCHRWKPHPGGSFSFFSGKGGTPDHLVKPSRQILSHMEDMQKKHKIRFPLEPGTGKVFCATCHNPHEKGVIKELELAKGADSKNRLRMQEICSNCHNK